MDNDRVPAPLSRDLEMLRKQGEALRQEFGGRPPRDVEEMNTSAAESLRKAREQIGAHVRPDDASTPPTSPTPVKILAAETIANAPIRKLTALLLSKGVITAEEAAAIEDPQQDV